MTITHSAAKSRIFQSPCTRGVNKDGHRLSAAFRKVVRECAFSDNGIWE